jgi:hypothetical protein
MFDNNKESGAMVSACPDAANCSLWLQGRSGDSQNVSSGEKGNNCWLPLPVYGIKRADDSLYGRFGQQETHNSHYV